MDENRFLGKFTEECLHLCDISPVLACAIIYGSWPSNRPDLGPSRRVFRGENYLRYSEAARKEVIEALIRCGNKQAFSDVIVGLIETSDFFKELDLWKSWGMDANFIDNELDEYVSLKVYHYTWLNAKLFAEILDYIGKELSEQEATDWRKGVISKHGLTPEIQQMFEDSIKKHIA